MSCREPLLPDPEFLKCSLSQPFTKQKLIFIILVTR